MKKVINSLENRELINLGVAYLNHKEMKRVRNQSFLTMCLVFISIFCFIFFVYDNYVAQPQEVKIQNVKIQNLEQQHYNNGEHINRDGNVVGKDGYLK